jgi:DHA2 family multidrug resistance protein
MSEATAGILPAARARSPKVIITAAIMAATAMQSLDSTIANVALPRMQGELSASQDQMGWVLTSYIVAAAITIPLTGWLATAFGRRRVLLVSIVIFTVASLLCGIATTLPQIVIFRLVQGVGGAALVPLSQAVLLAINEPKDYPKAMAGWAAAAQLGSIGGPALGGWLTENFNWRWTFYINLPIGILAFLGLLALREQRIEDRSRFDFLGFVVLSLALGALQLMLDRGQLQDWFSSKEICIEALIAGIALYVFVVHMFTTDRPFLNPGLFKDANFMASTMYLFLIGIVMYATLALLAPMLQEEYGYPVVLAGLLAAPRGVGVVIGMVLVGRLLALAGVRAVIAVGVVITALSLWQMSQFSLDMTYGPMITAGLIQGIGVSLIYVPLSSSAFQTLSPALRNEGAAFFSLSRNIGSSAGISVVFFLLVRNTQTVHASLAGLLRTPRGGAVSAAIAGADPFAGQSLPALNDAITQQSAFIAYIDDFRLMAVLTAATLPFVLLLRGGRAQAGGGGHAVID